MNVLVTGATGFTGWHAAARLREAGHQVRALVRDLEKGRRLLSPLGIEESDLVVGDMTDPEAVSRALDGCDAVLHSAALVSVAAPVTRPVTAPITGPVTSPGASADGFEANVVGTRLVVGGACERGIDSVLFVSSLTAIVDPHADQITAYSPLVECETRYGRSKAASDAFVRQLQAEGKSVSIVYPSAILGPDDPGRSESMSAYRGFLSRMIDSEGGMQFVDVRDLAILFERILSSGAEGRYVAAGSFCTWSSLIDLIEDVTGAKIGRIKAPGWLLRSAGSAGDLIGGLMGRSFPISREAMEVATRWRRVEDSPEIAKMDVHWRDPRETLADLYRWFAERGAIKPGAVPRLME
jgi:nucleoside-diphosphate-sugar epimerase